jgi:hypothetical protein
MANPKHPPGPPMDLKTRGAERASLEVEIGKMCGIIPYPRLISTLLLTVLFCVPVVVCIAADYPHLIQSMSLAAARKAVQKSGWIERGKPYCWTTSRTEGCGGTFSDDFLLKVPELSGTAGDTPLLYLCYTDGYGKNLTLSFGFDERFASGRGRNTDKLIQSMKLAHWEIEDGECTYTLGGD